MPKLTNKSYRSRTDGRTDVRTDPNYRNASLLKISSFISIKRCLCFFCISLFLLIFWLVLIFSLFLPGEDRIPDPTATNCLYQLPEFCLPEPEDKGLTVKNLNAFQARHLCYHISIFVKYISIYLSAFLTIYLSRYYKHWY